MTYTDHDRHCDIMAKLDKILGAITCDRPKPADFESRLDRLERDVELLKSERNPSKGREC